MRQGVGIPDRKKSTTRQWRVRLWLQLNRVNSSTTEFNSKHKGLDSSIGACFLVCLECYDKGTFTSVNTYVGNQNCYTCTLSTLCNPSISIAIPELDSISYVPLQSAVTCCCTCSLFTNSHFEISFISAYNSSNKKYIMKCTQCLLL